MRKLNYPSNGSVIRSLANGTQIYAIMVLSLLTATLSITAKKQPIVKIEMKYLFPFQMKREQQQKIIKNGNIFRTNVGKRRINKYVTKELLQTMTVTVIRE